MAEMCELHDVEYALPHTPEGGASPECAARRARPVNCQLPGVILPGTPAPTEEQHVARVVVEVMPKAEILDPQGQAIVGALARLGFAGVSDVRQGKRFELEIDGSVEDSELEKIAEGLLANTVIEDWAVRRIDVEA